MHASHSRSNEKPNVLFQPIQYNLEQWTKHIRVFTVETGSIPEGADKFYSSFSLAPECYLTAPDLKDVPSKPWLRFGKDEKWVINLIIAVTRPKNVRDVCENFNTQVRCKIRNAINDKRVTGACDSGDRIGRLSALADSGDRIGMLSALADLEEANSFKSIAAFEVEISGYPVFVLNNRQTTAFLMNEKFLPFMRDVLVPMAATAARRHLPNIPQKVIWDQAEQLWRIQVRNPKEPMEESPVFPVQLPTFWRSEQYFTEKRSTYLAAIRTWNTLDGSKRYRIGEHKRISDLEGHAMPSQADPSDSSGSQPSSLPSSD